MSSGVRLSYVWTLENDIRITPSVGADYSHVKTGSFTERVQSGSPGMGMTANKAKYHNAALPVMISASRTFSSDFLCLRGAPSLWTPEVRGGWVPQIGARHAKTRLRLAGTIATSSYRANSSSLADSCGTVGAGLKIRLADKYIFGVDYDCSFASRYNNHSVTAMYGVSF